MRWALLGSARGAPPAIWLALLGLGLTTAGLTAWSARGGAVHGRDAGERTYALRARDASPELAARSYYDALRAGRQDLARTLAANPEAAGGSRTNQRLLGEAPSGGPSTFRVDETRKLDDRTLRLIGVLAVGTGMDARQVGASFDVVSSSAGYRVARMQLTPLTAP